VTASHRERINLGLAGGCFLLVMSLILEARSTQDDVHAAQFVPAQVVTGGSQAVANVSIESFQYSPYRVRVSPESTVLWTNRDGVDHDVTFRQHDLESPLVGKGGKIAVMFEKPGEYRYYCHVHPFMQGTVIVE
jgi:plastocyanin